MLVRFGQLIIFLSILRNILPGKKEKKRLRYIIRALDLSSKYSLPLCILIDAPEFDSGISDSKNIITLYDSFNYLAHVILKGDLCNVHEGDLFGNRN